MTGSIFDDFAPQDPDATAPFGRPGAELLGSAPADAHPAAYARAEAAADAPFDTGYGPALLGGGHVPPPPPTGPFATGPAPALGEVPYVHTAPRAVRTLRRRVVVTAGSLAAGALAAGGAVLAIGGGDDPSVALANAAGSPSKTGEAPVDPSTRTGDVSRSDTRPGMCVRLDAAALAAIAKAEAGPKAAADADGRTVTIRLSGGDVTVPMSSVSVVRCSVPVAKRASSSAASSSSSSSSTSRKPAPAATTSTTRPRTTTSTTRPRSTTTTTRPSSTTTRPKTTTTTPPRTTSTTPKPKPSSSTKTSAS